MANEELKQTLGDDLCDYCPWKQGEIDHRCDSLCEGLYCDDALSLSWMKTKIILMMMRNK